VNNVSKSFEKANILYSYLLYPCEKKLGGPMIKVLLIAFEVYLYHWPNNSFYCPISSFPNNGIMWLRDLRASLANCIASRKSNL
jgi:hypothetical protein